MSKRPPPPGPVRLTPADVGGHRPPTADKAVRDSDSRRGPLATTLLLLLLLLLGGGIYYAAVALRVPNAEPRVTKADVKKPSASKGKQSAKPVAAASDRHREPSTDRKAAAKAVPTEKVPTEKVPTEKAAAEKVAAAAPAQPLGLYAERTRPDRETWIGGVGGTPESELGVAAGLDWLARHQAEDGHWGPDCLGSGGSRCEKEHPCGGNPGGSYEAALTGMALLAFQAGGNYAFNNRPSSEAVRRGLDWFVERQGPNGELVGSLSTLARAPGQTARYHQRYMYEHAIGTFALAEACAVARAARRQPDEKYLTAATQAVKFIESQQHEDGGWRYQPNKSAPSDCSVSGWSMLALKTAREADLPIEPGALRKMVAFFESQADPSTGRTYYQGRTFVTDATTGVGMMVDEFIEHKPDSKLVHQAALYLAKHAETKWGQGLNLLGPQTGSDFYLWYNCTLAMFMAGGEPWKRWNDVVRDHLLRLQLHGSECTRGSWEPNDRWGREGGRVYSTALAVLALEVYYRFAREREPDAAPSGDRPDGAKAPRDTSEPIDGRRYLPLEVGRELRYQVTVSPPVGGPRKATATNKVVERSELGGKGYFKVTTTIAGVPFVPDTLVYYRPAPEGVYQVLEGDEKAPEWLYLPAKIEIGDRWGAKTSGGDFEFTAAALEDVETPSGKYPQCLKLSVTMKQTLATNSQQQWLAADVGVVKQTDSNAFFSSTTVLEKIKASASALDPSR